MQPEWLERYGTRVENYRLPKTDTARQRLAAIIGADGLTLLHAAYAPEASSGRCGQRPQWRCSAKSGYSSTNQWF